MLRKKTNSSLSEPLPQPTHPALRPENRDVFPLRAIFHVVLFDIMAKILAGHPQNPILDCANDHKASILHFIQEMKILRSKKFLKRAKNPVSKWI